MMHEKLHARAEYSIYNNKINFFIRQNNHYAQPLEMKEVKEGCSFDNCFSVEYSQAQCLMDDLWRAGIRPKASAMASATLAAKDDHLNDMRMIAFNKLKIGLNK